MLHRKRFPLVFTALSIVLLAASYGAFRYERSLRTTELRGSPTCSKQWAHLDAERKKHDDAIALAERREAQFGAEASNPVAARYANAIQLAEAEGARARKLQSERRSLDIDASPRDALVLGVGMLIAQLLSIGLARCMLRHASSAVPGFRRALRPRRAWVPLYSLALSTWAVMFARNAWTSIFTTDKLSFSFGSYCVSQSSFWIARAVEGCFALTLAWPAGLAWIATQRSLIPSIALHVAARRRAAERYVAFLHVWALATVALTTALTIIWVRIGLAQSGVSSSETILDLLTGAGGLVAAVLLTFKFIRNGVLVRLEVNRLLDLWPEDRPAPRDPTRHFLGESWWTLPSTLFGIGATVWSVFEFTGLGKQVSELIN